METTQVSFDYSTWENPMGERCKDALRLNFNRKLKLEFHGIKVTSDAGFQAFDFGADTFGSRVMPRIAEKLGFQMATMLEVRKENALVPVSNQNFCVAVGSGGHNRRKRPKTLVILRGI